jgi:hypothetical protein
LDGSKVILKKPLENHNCFSKGKMVGHIVSKHGGATNLKKLDRISNLPFPTTKKTKKVL